MKFAEFFKQIRKQRNDDLNLLQFHANILYVTLTRAAYDSFEFPVSFENQLKVVRRRTRLKGRQSSYYESLVPVYRKLRHSSTFALKYPKQLILTWVTN